MKIEVYLHAHGQRQHVGTLADDRQAIFFKYSPDFLEKDIHLSPFHLPLSPQIFEDRQRTFHGLFGLFNDSLPDGWGLLLLDRALQKQGIRLDDTLPLLRLAGVGKSGMGALEYEPAGPQPDSACIGMEGLDFWAKESHNVLCDGPVDAHKLDTLMRLNGASAGVRPKILVDVDAARHIVPPGQGTPWIIKFRSLHDRQDAGLEEYLYSLAAQKAGLTMPETGLFPSQNCPGYFGVKRFDRAEGKKIHMHTACGLLHASHREPSLDYTSLLTLTHTLTRDIRQVKKMVQLMVFNVKSGNHDDHSKNFSFLMDSKAAWKMAPAYDLTPSQGFHGERMAMVNGKGRDIDDGDLLKIATRHAVTAQEVKEIIEKTQQALSEIPHMRKAVLEEQADRKITAL